jgi:hypothetical protein
MKKVSISKKEIEEFFIEKLFTLEVRGRDFVFRRELERLSRSLPSWEEQEILLRELTALAEERGFRII